MITILQMIIIFFENKNSRSENRKSHHKTAYVYFVVKNFSETKHTKNEVIDLTYPLALRFN